MTNRKLVLAFVLGVASSAITQVHAERLFGWIDPPSNAELAKAVQDMHDMDGLRAREIDSHFALLDQRVGYLEEKRRQK